MAGTRRAVIDVGTNSIKLLVADVDGRSVKPLLEQSKQTRLGRGFYQTHLLQPGAIAATAKAVGDFARAARTSEALAIRVIATSAAREAINGCELVSAIERETSLKVEIISGEQEAELAFRGVTSDPKLAQEPLLLTDVGGGSTEFVVGQDTHQHFKASFPLGSVRLMELCPHSNPPKPEELSSCRKSVFDFLLQEVKPKLGPALQSCAGGESVLLVGTGGTATILARMEAELDDYDRARIEATRLSRQKVQWHVNRLWSLPLEARKKIVGLPPERADVILTGAIIYQQVMEVFNFPKIRVSTRGLRFAAVLSNV